MRRSHHQPASDCPGRGRGCGGRGRVVGAHRGPRRRRGVPGRDQPTAAASTRTHARVTSERDTMSVPSQVPGVPTLCFAHVGAAAPGARVPAGGDVEVISDTEMLVPSATFGESGGQRERFQCAQVRPSRRARRAHARAWRRLSARRARSSPRAAAARRCPRRGGGRHCAAFPNRGCGTVPRSPTMGSPDTRVLRARDSLTWPIAPPPAPPRAGLRRSGVGVERQHLCGHVRHGRALGSRRAAARGNLM